jgi:hypothetical protein
LFYVAALSPRDANHTEYVLLEVATFFLRCAAPSGVFGTAAYSSGGARGDNYTRFGRSLDAWN